MQRYLVGFLMVWMGTVDLSIAQSISLQMYSQQDGLSHNIVRNIAQDKFGHIWIGTEYGLNKYNGHEFVNYLHDPFDSTSISSNLIFGLATDQSGLIWVGTEDGLNVFDPVKNQFRAFKSSHETNSISDNHIRVVFVDSKNRVWIGTDEGLNLFDRKDSTFLRFRDERQFSSSFAATSLSFNRINAITEDSQGRIWVGADGGGIKIYEDNLGDFTALHAPASKENYLFDIIRTIYQAEDGRFWLGTDGGLVKYDEERKDFMEFRPSANPDSLGYQYIWSIFEGPDQQIWASSYGGGLFIFNQKTQQFTAHRQIAGRTDGYDDNLIWAMFKDRDDNVWVGFDGNGGLGYYNPNQRKFQHLLGFSDQSRKQNISNIIEISEDSLLVDSFKSRFLLLNDAKMVPLNHLNPVNYTEKKSIPLRDGYLFGSSGALVWTDKLLRIRHTFQSPFIGFPTCFAEGRTGIVWVGTLSQGLIKLDLTTKKMIRYFTEGNSKIYTDSRSIQSLHWSSDSLLWIGASRSGLFAFNPVTEEKRQYLYHQNDFFEPTINVMEMGHDQKLWLGTREYGLLKFNARNNEVEDTPISKRLGRDQIRSIIEDEKDRLWVSTSKGLVVHDQLTDSTFRFGLEDGLQSTLFNEAAFQGSSGFFYFGGENGINRFKPATIVVDTVTRPVLIEEVILRGRGNQEAIKQWTAEKGEMEELSLAYDENDLMINFSANNYLHTDYQTFEYAINKAAWQSIGNQHQLNLSNLAPGSYRVAIRGINHDGVAGDARVLSIDISPPWWTTWWFMVLMGTLLAVVATLYFSTRLKRIKQQNALLEQQVNIRTKELELSKQQIQSDKETIEKALGEREALLREIHHRVKNNLQIIANLLYLQSGKTDNAHFKDILEEGQGRVRSMALIHQKLYENEDLKSIPFGEYIGELIQEIKTSFGQQSAHVSVKVKAEEAFFDVDSAVPLGLIINELTTNAFKYAFNGREEGNFSVFLTKEGDEYVLHVADDGKGLPEEIDIRKTRSLGLRLVRILSEQLEGEYKFESQDGMSFELRFAA